MTERVRVRVKATAKITSHGWRGILVIERGNDRYHKRGPARISLDEAEADAQALLKEFQKALKGDDGTLPLPEKEKTNEQGQGNEEGQGLLRAGSQ